MLLTSLHIALLLLQVPQVAGEPTLPCLGGHEVKVHTPGMDDLKSWAVSLCRYSDVMDKYVTEFKAYRAMEKTDSGLAKIRVTVQLRDGHTATFDVDQTAHTNEYSADTYEKYNAVDVVSFKVDAIRESWLDDAETARQTRKEQESLAAKERELARLQSQEREKQSLTCRRVYRETSEKKVIELTVREARLIRACESLQLYSPGRE